MTLGDDFERAVLRLRTGAVAAIAAGLALAASSDAALADRIENGIAVFSALDKVTATIKRIEVPLNETAQFGALKVTPHVCYSRPPTEQPKTTSFVEVDEVLLDGKEKRLFNGWMFAESPGLNAVEHPVFDVWLTECIKPKKSIAQRAPDAGPPVSGTQPGADAPPAPDDTFDDTPRRRVRR